MIRRFSFPGKVELQAAALVLYCGVLAGAAQAHEMSGDVRINRVSDFYLGCMGNLASKTTRHVADVFCGCVIEQSILHHGAARADELMRTDALLEHPYFAHIAMICNARAGEAGG